MFLFNSERKKGEKSFDFYVVSRKETPTNFLTVTCTQFEAVEYAHKMFKLEHLEHFNMWKELHELSDTEETWYRYFNTVLDDENKKEFIVNKVKYKLKDIVAIMRMFGGCVPLGCSFDTKTEKDYLILKTQKLTEKIVKDLENLDTETKSKYKKSTKVKNN